MKSIRNVYLMSRLPPTKQSSKLPPIRGPNNRVVSSKKPPMPKGSYARQKSRGRLYEDGVLQPKNQYSRGDSRTRKSSRNIKKKPVNNHMLHYNEYLQKLSEENKRKMDRNKNSRNDNGPNRAKENRGKVYRSRVSSADVNRNRNNGYNRAYGFKPIWWG